MAPTASDWTRKTDPRLQTLFARRRAADDSDETVRVMVRLAGEVDPDALRALGLALGSVAGSIATASLRLQNLPEVAAEPTVSYIELSTPLGPDPGTAAARPS